ncbi:hypothetical protein IAR50_001722 [Cryptococcus sp. DSM 104548]
MARLTPEEMARLEELGQSHYASNKNLAFIPILTGFALTCAFFGLLVLQVLFWIWRAAKRDWWVIKLVVAHVFLAAAAYMALEFVWIADNFATGFGTYYHFYKFSPVANFFLITIMQTPVSGFFSARAYRLTRGNRVAAIVPNVLLFISFASGITLRIVAPVYATGLTWNVHPVTVSMLFVWASSAMVADLIVTFTITYALLQSKLGFTGFVRTDKLIKKVIIISVEAQLIPTLCSLAFLITFATTPGTEIAALWLFTPLMYPIAFMAVLNSRKGLARQLGQPTGQVNHLSQLPTLQISSSNLTYDHPGLEGVLPQLSMSPSEVIRAQAGSIAVPPSYATNTPRVGRDSGEGDDWESKEDLKFGEVGRDEEGRIGSGLERGKGSSPLGRGVTASGSGMGLG